MRGDVAEAQLWYGRALDLDSARDARQPDSIGTK